MGKSIEEITIDLLNKKKKDLSEVRKLIINDLIMDKIGEKGSFLQIEKESSSINREADIKLENMIRIDFLTYGKNRIFRVKIQGKNNYNNLEGKEKIFREEFYSIVDDELKLIGIRMPEEDIVLSEKYRDIPNIKEQIASLEDMEEALEKVRENQNDVTKIVVPKSEEKEVTKDDEEEKKNENEESRIEEIDGSKIKKYKISTLQELKTDMIVDGKQTLGKALNLEEYNKLYVVYAEKVRGIENEDGSINERNNGRYALIGEGKDGKIKVLSNDEFELDRTSGIDPAKKDIRFNADADKTTEMNDKVQVRYKRQGTDKSISMYMGEYGQIKVFYESEATRQDNTKVGIEVESRNTYRPYVNCDKNVLNPNRGINAKEDIEREVKGKIKNGDERLSRENSDGRSDYIGRIESEAEILKLSSDDIIVGENGDKLTIQELADKQKISVKGYKEAMLKTFRENRCGDEGEKTDKIVAWTNANINGDYNPSVLKKR